MSAAAAAGDVSGKRMLYGLNAVVQGLLFLALVMGAVFVAQRYQGQVDLTSAGVNSLSPGTLKLVRGLEQDIEITAVYGIVTEYDKLLIQRQKMVRELLDLYRNANPARVSTTVIDPLKEAGRVSALLERLRSKPAYKNEAEPHARGLEQFARLREQIETTTTQDFETARRLLEGNPQLGRVREFNIIGQNLGVISRDAKRLAGTVANVTKGEVPRYGAALDEVRTFLTSARAALQDALTWMKNEAGKPEYARETVEFFQGAATRYEPLLAEIDALSEALRDLKSVKLEELYEGLLRWPDAPPILVETSNEARLVSFEDVWPHRPQGATPGELGEDRDFNGEAAVSSAILALVQPVKTAVVFTRFGGESPLRPDFSRFNPMMMQQLPTARFGELNEALQRANFLTEDWDVATQKSPPQVEDAGRTVYVVLPPEPPEQPNPMRPAPQAGMSMEDRQIVTQALEQSGMAIFLAGWEMPRGPFAPTSGAYEFGDYLRRTWGIEVLRDFLALAFNAVPDRPGVWVPSRDAIYLRSAHLALGEHPVTAPLASSPIGLQLTAPVVPTSQPAGVRVETLIEVRQQPDVWAVRDVDSLQRELQQNMGVQPREEDRRAPFPVALAAEHQEGRRVIVIGSEEFVSNNTLQAMQFVRTAGGGLAFYSLFPGNADLFLNALHWLTGNADRIAVGPRRAEPPRLDQLTEAQADTWHVIFVGIWPALALLVGGGVYFLRRR